MKKAIVIVMLLVTLTSSPITQVQAAEVVIGGEIGIALMELILGTAVSYELAQKIKDVQGNILGFTFGSAHDGYILTEQDIIAMEQADASLDNKMDVLYEGSDYKVRYVDGQTYGSTNYDGQEYFLNPYLVNALVSANAWTQLLKVNSALNTMSISTAYMATQALKQDVTQKQIEMANAVQQCFTMVATAMQSAKISLSPTNGLTNKSFLLDQCIQSLKYDKLPTWAKTYANTYQYYYVMENIYASNGVLYPIYMIFFQMNLHITMIGD